MKSCRAALQTVPLCSIVPQLKINLALRGTQWPECVRPDYDFDRTSVPLFTDKPDLPAAGKVVQSPTLNMTPARRCRVARSSRDSARFPILAGRPVLRRLRVTDRQSRHLLQSR